MSRRSNLTIVYDMLLQIEAINRFLLDIDKETFLKDLEKQYACDRAFEILGEAAKQLNDDFTNKHNHIEWQKIKAFRNLLIHEYFRVERNIQWNIIHNNLPMLQVQLAELIKSLEIEE